MRSPQLFYFTFLTEIEFSVGTVGRPGVNSIGKLFSAGLLAVRACVVTATIQMAIVNWSCHFETFIILFVPRGG